MAAATAKRPIAAAMSTSTLRAHVATLRAELVAAQERVADLASQLGDAQAECVARVEKTKQAASLRQMLTKKNVLVKQLRDTLIANGIQP